MLEWYRIYKNEKLPVVASHGKCLLLIASEFVPLAAAVAAMTGRRSGDLAALKEYANSTSGMTCEVCCVKLDRAGYNHAPNCELAKKSIEVIKDKTSPEHRQLLADRDRLIKKLSTTEEKLARIEKKNIQTEPVSLTEQLARMEGKYIQTEPDFSLTEKRINEQ